MYNRYIPDDAFYTPIAQQDAVAEQPQQLPRQTAAPPRYSQAQRPPEPHPGQGEQRPFGTASFKLPSFLSGAQGLSSLLTKKEGGGLSGLLKTLKLDDIDTGDILLLLIILYLLIEGDDLELVIALGLVLIMGLGDNKKDEADT